MKQKLKNDSKFLPAAQGYRMPAEWERHEATWLSWPHDLETWPNELLELEATYIEIIEYLSSNEKIHILVQGPNAETYVSQKLAERGIQNVLIHQIRTNSPWIRDYGPIFIVKKRKLAFTDWAFNSWGRKYSLFEEDDLVPKQLHELMSIPRFPVEMVFEGGSIDVNGLGTGIVTEECLLNPNRNPKFSRKEIEKKLSDFLSVNNTIWLKKGIEGDDTDGHVDEVARFTDPKTVVAAVEENSKDPNHSRLQENWEILSRAKDQDGKKLNIIGLPLPHRVERNSKRFPASYLNFYIANEYVLVPVFGDRNDTKALGVLKNLFSGRTVVGIPAFPLIYGNGAVHCITQQEPSHED